MRGVVSAHLHPQREIPGPQQLQVPPTACSAGSRQAPASDTTTCPAHCTPRIRLAAGGSEPIPGRQNVVATAAITIHGCGAESDRERPTNAAFHEPAPSSALSSPSS
ncbi:hypothetical protein ACCO45_006977 [Purpureocillium lilacinum]|uniref:Uncharacterized protein n=1 Tax=Purpureocillium lilacinum TaxID=33203 RepID=A0ACC4DR11_PURLI